MPRRRRIADEPKVEIPKRAAKAALRSLETGTPPAQWVRDELVRAISKHKGV